MNKSMIFINTRPTTRAKNLTDFLQAQGINALELPLLDLVACELSEQECQYLTQINDYQALIFVSETAVSYFFNFIQNNQIFLNKDMAFVAVGQKTAQIFTNLWQNFYTNFPTILTPSQFNLPENNEGMLRLPLIQQLKKDEKVLMLKGKGGRELLKNTLVTKGVLVDEVDFYQRIFPASSVQIFQEFCQGFDVSSKPMTLVTSLMAWQSWQMLIQNKFYPSNFAYLVLQQRIADNIVQHIEQKPSITVIEDLRPETILYAIQNSPVG